MELGKKIFSLRKKAGLSQEKLADILKVSRQTISKWELGDTAPDIIESKEISKIFNVSLDELLDNDIREILESKISNTERLSAMIMRILKITGISVIIILIIYLFYYIFFSSTYAWFIGNNKIDCQIEDKHYSYKIEVEINKIQSNKLFDRSIEIEQSNKISNIYRDGGNAYLSSIIDLEKYEYTYQLFDAVYAYVDEHGGFCN